MFASLFVKKRITHKVLAKQFVHKTLRTVDETFEDFLDAIYNDSELLNPASYGVGKAGILAFTRYVASFWGKYNIRCNAISPGPFLEIYDKESPHTQKFIESLNNKKSNLEY